MVLTAGILGLVFSIASLPLAIVGCCCPFAGLGAAGIALPLSVIALSVGWVDTAQAAAGRRERSGASQVGMMLGGGGIILGLIGLIIALLWMLVFAAGATAPPATKPPGRPAVPPNVEEGLGDANPLNPNRPQDIKPPEPKEPPGPTWTPAARAITHGDLQVRIAKANIGKVPLKDLFGEDSRSRDDLLIIRLDLRNTNPTKKVEYRSWRGAGFTLERDYATLKDNFENSYKRITFGAGSYPTGAVERSESIYPNKAVTDVLVFEAPLDTASHLDLELPAKNYGGEGMIRFRIPITSIQKP